MVFRAKREWIAVALLKVDAGVPIQVVTWNLSINKLHTDVWQKGIVRSPPGTAARRVRIAD